MAAYYAKPLVEFLADSTTSIIGILTEANARARFLHLESSQTESWRAQIDMLKDALGQLLTVVPEATEWGVALEFPVPRRMKRIDIVVLGHDIIFVIEFKSGTADHSALTQVEDYALDLADFHEPSQRRTIIPIVVAEAMTFKLKTSNKEGGGGIQPCLAVRREGLAAMLGDCWRTHTRASAERIDLAAWDHGRYHPVPTIIEAARGIFANMEVREIAHAHCEPHNLTVTVDALVDRVLSAQAHGRKTICFVTGVPGSGKTLAGLRAVHDARLQQADQHASFLSGNGPLVRILQEALVRDFADREGSTKGAARRKAKTLISNVHVFARHYWEAQAELPFDRIVVFDEAQRAWDRKRNEQKFGRDISEPEMILEIMDRFPDWAVIVALVGGGQEINDGEAGLAEWGRALAGRFSHWQVVTSPEAMEGGHSVAGDRLFEENTVHPESIALDPVLHLPVSTRSYRAVAINDWANAVLKGNATEAREAVGRCETFPVYLARDLQGAKCWLRERRMGTIRCGLVASSGGARLRAEGLETSTGFHREYPYEYWFLNDEGDVRSSNQLEVVATEFEIQGLELDWVGVCWDADLIWDMNLRHWSTRRFVGTDWKVLKNARKREYLFNSYRVLLTRSRQGMVIWVPTGSASDTTRVPRWYDETADFLQATGVQALD
jgi:hypothetical protein